MSGPYGFDPDEVNAMAAGAQPGLDRVREALDESEPIEPVNDRRCLAPLGSVCKMADCPVHGPKPVNGDILADEKIADLRANAARAFTSALAGAPPQLSNLAGSGELWTVAKGGRIARSLKGTPVVQKLRSWACHRAVKLAVALGFPFGGLTISHHSPQWWDDGEEHTDRSKTEGATSINLLWRGREYSGFLVPEDPRK